MEDLVTVITPSYNSSKFIAETINSVLNQTYTNWEMLIVDDNSSDTTIEVIGAFLNDHRIKLFPLKNNVGAAVARNIALEKASGKFIAFLDSDDIWEKDKLKTQINFMKLNNYAFTFSSYGIINEDSLYINKKISAVNEIDYSQYLKNTIIGCLTVVIDKSITGDFRMPLIRSGQDMALWLQIMKRGHIAYGIPKILAHYRICKNSLSSNKLKKINYVWKVYRNIEQLSVLMSSYFIICFIFNALRKRF